MTPLEKAYQKFLENNPTYNYTFEEWKEIILPQSDLYKEHMSALMEIQKMTQKLLEKQNK
jgi:hypothetical protein